MRVMALAFSAALALALAPSLARAQVREDDNPRPRDACRLATQVLTKGRPEPHYDWALDIISSCDRSAGEALAAAWQKPPENASDLERITRASYLTRDGRIFAAVLHAAGDASIGTPQRVAAVLVIGTYLKPDLALSVKDLQPGSSVVIATVSHSAQRDGAVPVAPADLQAARDLLVRLAAAPDPALAYAAGKVNRVTK